MPSRGLFHQRLLTFGAVLLLATVGRAQQKIQWRHDLEQAKATASRSGRLLLVHFTAPWCAPCQRMKRDVLSQPNVKNLISRRYVPVEINLDQNKQLAKSLDVSKIPTDLVLTPQGEIVLRMQGVKPVSQYYSRLSDIASRFQPHSASPQTAQQQAPRGALSQAPPSQPSQMQAETQVEQNFSGDYRGQQLPPWETGTPPTSRRANSNAAVSPAPVQRPSVRQIDVSPQGTVVRNNPSPPSAPRPSAPEQRPAVEQQASVEALDGFCPVSLVEGKQWTRGDRRWGAIHRGQTYLFTGAGEQRRFLANPEAYAPVAQGADPVIALEEGRQIPGRR
ncbi:MAG: thioredoxin family protein, partial [Planctomycetales bacterium]